MDVEIIGKLSSIKERIAQLSLKGKQFVKTVKKAIKKNEEEPKIPLIDLSVEDYKSRSWWDFCCRRKRE
jgi:hypothetical protein